MLGEIVVLCRFTPILTWLDFVCDYEVTRLFCSLTATMPDYTHGSYSKSPEVGLSSAAFLSMYLSKYLGPLGM